MTKDEAIEAAAKAIYDKFPGAGDHPWQDFGNSFKQYDARYYARAALSAIEAPTSEAVAWAYECRQPHTDPVVWAEFIGRTKPTENNWIRNVSPLFAAPVLDAVGVEKPQQGWISVDVRLPKREQLVMVYSPPTQHDHPGEVNITFDCIDPNDDDAASWLGHNEHYEHFCCVAKPEGSIGPSEKAPYTHWMPLPPAPSEQSAPAGSACQGGNTSDEAPAAAPAPTDAGIPISDDAFGFALMEHLGPAALTGGKMSPYRAFELGWQARGQQQAGVPDGYVVVPKVMTDAMRDAGNEIILNRCHLVRAYKAMLAAAPSVPREA